MLSLEISLSICIITKICSRFARSLGHVSVPLYIACFFAGGYPCLPFKPKPVVFVLSWKHSFFIHHAVAPQIFFGCRYPPSVYQTLSHERSWSVVIVDFFLYRFFAVGLRSGSFVDQLLATTTLHRHAISSIQILFFLWDFWCNTYRICAS